MRRSNASIVTVVRDGMCTGCGFCASVCARAIRMDECAETGLIQPLVLDDKCVNCGKCLQVCPALTWPEFIGSGLQEGNLGRIESVWAVHSTEPTLRHAATSGGFVTSAILYLLESGRITGALLTGRKTEDPLRCELRLARTSDEVHAAMGSKYSPVSFDGLIPMVKELPEDERLAVVGLPCHVQGLSMSAARSSRLARMIQYKISLVCGGVPSFFAYSYILRRLGIRPDQIAEFHNRGGGWPGVMRIVLKNDPHQKIEVPYGSPLAMGMTLSSPLFRPQACQLCADPHGFHTDIAVSDAWLPKYRNQSNEGWNLILVKTTEGAQLINEMRCAGRLTAEPSSVDEFINANRRVFKAKLESRRYGLKWILGTERSRPYRDRTESATLQPLGAIARLKLLVYYKHVAWVGRLRLAKLPFPLLGVLLRYMKVISLLK